MSPSTLCGVGRLSVQATFVLLALAVPLAAQRLNDEAKSLITLWSKSTPPILEFRDLARSSGGSVALLAEDSARNKSLLIGADASGPGHLIPLPGAKGARGDELRLVRGVGETLWIGGSRHFRRAAFDALLSDAYLAKLDRAGQLEWERDFGGQSARAI